jgi:hypothetical protein
MARKRLDKEDRLEQHYRRLGTREPQCVVCGETDPRCMEKHHGAGRKFHKETWIICRNCHRKLSDVQLDHPPYEPNVPVEQLTSDGRYLLGTGDLLALLEKRLREIGRRLIDKASRTDDDP